MTQLDPQEALRSIQERLDRGDDPAGLIEELLPRNPADGLTWARLLTAWEGQRGRMSDQAVAIARSVSLRAMRTFGLVLTRDGHIVPREHQEPRQPPQPALTFPLAVAGEELRVEYTPEYFPGRDHFAFLSPHEPARPHGLSQTGYRSQFAPRDAVAACGGPEGYAARFVEASLRSLASEFEATFEENWREKERSRRQRSGRGRTARAADQGTEPQQPEQLTQGELF